MELSSRLGPHTHWLAESALWVEPELHDSSQLCLTPLEMENADKRKSWIPALWQEVFALGRVVDGEVAAGSRPENTEGLSGWHLSSSSGGGTNPAQYDSQDKVRRDEDSGRVANGADKLSGEN